MPRAAGPLAWASQGARAPELPSGREPQQELHTHLFPQHRHWEKSLLFTLAALVRMPHQNPKNSRK